MKSAPIKNGYFYIEGVNKTPERKTWEDCPCFHIKGKLVKI